MKNGFSKTWNGIGYRRRQRGASLLEGIAYLGIAAIVILGAVSLLTSAFGNAQSNRATEEIIALRTAARKLYVGQTYPTAAGAMNTSLIAAHAVPATLTAPPAGSAITNSWGGAVTVQGNAAGGFTITYNNVPQAECIGILSGANGWTNAGVGTNAWDTTATPLTAGNATTACAASTGNVVTFTVSG
jgi:hypothetical protein